MKNKLKGFLNDQQQVTVWPAKHENKMLVISYLAEKFNPTKVYNENQVNEVLKSWHTFNDWPLLRRSLVDYGLLERNTAGTIYRSIKKT